MPSLRKNFFYNAILTLSGYIFPLMVYPYVSRILGVENMGACNFVDSIVEYFTILSMMGMNTVGIREIAKCKGNRAELDKTFSELFSLNTITTLLAVSVLTVAVFTVPKFQAYRELMYIGIGKLFFNYMLINWFFQGLEDFKYITARYIVVKMMFVASVFLLVHTKEDVVIYYLLVALTWAVNGVINFFYARRFITFRFTIRIRKTIVYSFFIMGIYWLMNSMYTTFNVAFLGFATNDVEVGLFTTANKLVVIIMALFTALTQVLIPKMSKQISEGSIDVARQLINTSENLLGLFSIPMIIFVFVMSPELIYVMSGSGYEGAIIPLRIMSVLFILMGYNQILVLQILLPMGKDKDILRNSAITACVGVVLVTVLVSYFGRFGASFEAVLGELTLFLLSQICVNKHFGISPPLRNFAKVAFFSLPIILFGFLCKKLDSPLVSLTLCSVITFIYTYIIGCGILKIEAMQSLNAKIISLIKNRTGI